MKSINPCFTCGFSKRFVPSKRPHGRPPRKFWICTSCKAENQGVLQPNGKIKLFNTSVPRGGTHVISLRLSDAQLQEFIETKQTSRAIFELGLNVYKDLMRINTGKYSDTESNNGTRVL